MSHTSMQLPKTAVFTCITGGYDLLKPVRASTPGVDYICFSDVAFDAPAPWQVRVPQLPGLSAKDVNRYVKMHPHLLLPEYELTVYVDGNMHVTADLRPLLQEVLASPGEIFIYEHWARDCIYKEAAICAHFANDWVWTIAAQMRRYQKEGFPPDQGLFENSVIIRKNTAAVRGLMEDWWAEYARGAKRDQLSLTVVAWRRGVTVSSLGPSDPRFGHKYFLYEDHPKRPRTVANRIRGYVNHGLAWLLTYERLFGSPRRIAWRPQADGYGGAGGGRRP